jgi:large subunit ribosomal protein L9
MKVLLCQDVEKLGLLGDVLEVAEGHARNYLLPKGLAVAANNANVKKWAGEKAKRSEERIKERGRMEKAAEAVNGAEAVIAAKANEAGVLFGSVTAGEIAANLREQGFGVADTVVQLAEHIKQTGNYQVTLKFADDLSVIVNVVVVAGGEDRPESQ